jgi:hypothetical protein
LHLAKSNYEMVRAKMKVDGAEFGEDVPAGNVELSMSKIPN